MESESTIINLPVPHKNYNKKIDKMVETLYERGDKITVDFIGSDAVESMFYLYLLKKYKSNCFILDKRVQYPLGLTFNLNTRYTQVDLFNNNRHYNVVAEMLTRCISNDSTPIIIIPITIFYLHQSIDHGHANVFIYRKHLNQLEHFEPQMTDYNDVILNVEIEKFIRILNDKLMLINGGKQVVFVDAMQICPKRHGITVGIQQLEIFSDLLLVKNIEPGGYCLAWSMFFTELCLKNPEIPSSIILQQIFEKLSDLSLSDASNYLRNVIRGYAGFINDKISKYFSLFGGLDILTIQKIKKLKPVDLIRLKAVIRELIIYEMEITINPNYINERRDIVKKSTSEIITSLGFKPKNFIRNRDVIDDDSALFEKYDQFHNNSFSPMSSVSSMSSLSSENDEELLKQMETELIEMFTKGKGTKDKGTKYKRMKKQKTKKTQTRKSRKQRKTQRKRVK